MKLMIGSLHTLKESLLGLSYFGKITNITITAEPLLDNDLKGTLVCKTMELKFTKKKLESVKATEYSICLKTGDITPLLICG